MISELNLKIKSGENWCVVGNNASGKSIVGRELYKIRDNSGLVSFETIEDLLEEERLKDDTDFIDREDPGTLVKDFLRESHNEFDLSGILNRGLKYLSTGELTKVVILKELEKSPSTLILDEPFDGMDLESQKTVEDIIATLASSSVTLILIVNRDSDIHRTIENIALIDNFRVAVTGKREILKQDSYKLLRHYTKELPTILPGQEMGDKIREELFSFRDVSISFGDTRVLDSINWSVNSMEHYKITGPNGSGKSTLLKIISADSNQSYGKDITLFGIKRGSGESIWDIKKHVGLVSSTLQKDYRVTSTLLSVVISGFYDSIGLYNSPTPNETTLGLEWLKIGGLLSKKDTPFKSLSYGEQRVGLILRALVKHPKVLILDEPCLGLDEINREMILKLIENIAQMGSTTILYVSHRREDIIPSITRELVLTPSDRGSRGIINETYIN